jgi:DNA (cytosine-5)-methyltransferase 1
VHAERSQSGRSSFRFCELFAGIGGFRLGLEPLGGKCTFASEIEADARQVYTKNFGGEPPAGNILDISTDDIPAFDLLTGGFPCQSWSEAGDVGGFADLRGVLFF